MSPQITIIAPLYNESKSFSFLTERLNKVMETSDLSIEVLLVDDGSKDDTADRMYQTASLDRRYHCLFLSRNYGHQIALTAGLQHAKATEAVFVIDGDLQDPPELLNTFYDFYKQGYDVVYGIRKKRKESLMKKISYHIYYRIQKRISNINVPLDSGDFSLLSRRVVDILNNMPEESRYIRGMRSWIGFKQIGVEYDRNERVAGSPQYTWKMLFNLAFNGIFNFSEIPIKTITKLGLYSIVIGLLYFLYALFRKVFFNDVPTGFLGLLFAIIMLGGVQLVSLGVIGEYILRIFYQVKNRPLYIVKDEIIEKKQQRAEG